MEVLALAMALPLALIVLGLRYVPEDTVVTVHRFGRYARTLLPGLRFTLPFLDQISHRVRLAGHQVAVPVDSEMAAHAEVYYQILEPERTGDALERVDAVVEHYVGLVLQQIPKNVVFDDAEYLAIHLQTSLNDDLSALGVRVIRCKLPIKSAA